MAKSNERKAKDKLIGLFFHSYPNGRLRWQGRILRKLKPGLYRAELYSWVTGMENGAVLVDREQMADEDWEFYTAAEWRFA